MLVEGEDNKNTNDVLHYTALIVIQKAYAITISDSIIRNSPVTPNEDSSCISIGVAPYTNIKKNEIYDCAGDGIIFNHNNKSNEGTRITGNHFYVNPDLYRDCSPSPTNPNGECSCSENGIAIKHVSNQTSDKYDFLYIANNVFEGFRKTYSPCSGSGSLGPAMIIRGDGSSNINIHHNLFLDSQVGLRIISAYGIPNKILIHDNLFVKNNQHVRIQGGDNIVFAHNTLLNGNDKFFRFDNASNSIATSNLFMFNQEGIDISSLHETSIISNNGFLDTRQFNSDPSSAHMDYVVSAISSLQQACWKSHPVTDTVYLCYNILPTDKQGRGFGVLS